VRPRTGKGRVRTAEVRNVPTAGSVGTGRGERPVVRVAAAIAACALLLGGLWWAGMRWQQAERASLLPSPPPGRQPPAVAEHLAAAYAAAMRAPSSIAPVGALCLAYHADMFFEQAERCYARASVLTPKDWRWTYYRALIDAERGGSESLSASLRRVVGQVPEFGPAWLRLGDAEFKAGRYDAAAEAWRRAAALPEPDRDAGPPPHVTEAPVSAYASLGLARIALVRGEVDRARDLLEGVVGNVPTFGTALRLLAECYRRLGREREAERAIGRAGRLPPYAPYSDPMIDMLARESRNSTLLLRLASEADLSTNAAWSEFLTRRALAFDPDNPEVVVKLGRILRTIGRNEEALEYFQRYQQMVPDDYQAYAHIGSCLSALGRFAEAESYFRRALTVLDDPVTHYNMGLLLALTGRPDQAVGEYEKALDRDPGHGDARTNLAAALARLGRTGRAVQELERVLATDPENAMALTNLGLLERERGAIDRARAHLEQALRFAPGLTPAADALASLPPRSVP